MFLWPLILTIKLMPQIYQQCFKMVSASYQDVLSYFFSLYQAFKAIKSFLSKLETVSEDPTKLAEIGM